jgi:hypothetical protein
VPRIRDLGTRLRFVISFTPRSLYPQGKSLWYTLHRRLGGPQSRSRHGGKEKNSQPLPGLELPIIQLVACGFSDKREGNVFLLRLSQKLILASDT